MKSNIFFVVLLLIVANCIARNIKHQLNDKNERLNSLIKRNQTNDASCELIGSLMQICLNVITGVVTDVESIILDCDTAFGFYIYVNASTTNSTFNFHQFNGTVLTECLPLKTEEYNITGQAYFVDSKMNGTVSMCNDGCINISFVGFYESIGTGEGYDVAVEGEVCRQ